jgi:hypothetical protein
MNAAFLAALLAVESGGNDLAVGDHGRAIGALQIHAAVVVDVNRRHGTSYTHREMHDRAKAVRVASLYLQTYAPGASPEVQARVWNGGPRGATKPATLGYWARVRREMGGAR